MYCEYIKQRLWQHALCMQLNLLVPLDVVSCGAYQPAGSYTAAVKRKAGVVLTENSAC
jgi:hypothetical protein